jgi:5-methylcytosine-specific restriction endonuclease McrA
MRPKSGEATKAEKITLLAGLGVLSDEAVVLAEYEQIVRSPSLEVFVPSVIALKCYFAFNSSVRFTRYNLFLRDKFTCLYCDNKFLSSELTFDHVYPRTSGGKTEWENIATACLPCNQKKGSKLLHECGMKIKYLPYIPTHSQFRRMSRVKQQFNDLHQSWIDYLYWSSELGNE